METKTFEGIRDYIERRIETLTYELAHAQTMDDVKYIQGQVTELGMLSDKLRQFYRK